MEATVISQQRPHPSGTFGGSLVDIPSPKLGGRRTAGRFAHPLFRHAPASLSRGTGPKRRWRRQR